MCDSGRDLAHDAGIDRQTTRPSSGSRGCRIKKGAGQLSGHPFDYCYTDSDTACSTSRCSGPARASEIARVRISLLCLLTATRPSVNKVTNIVITARPTADSFTVDETLTKAERSNRIQRELRYDAKRAEPGIRHVASCDDELGSGSTGLPRAAEPSPPRAMRRHLPGPGSVRRMSSPHTSQLD